MVRRDRESRPGLEAELRVSHGGVVAAVAVTGVLLVMMVETQSRSLDPLDRWNLGNLGLALLVSSMITWLLNQWDHRVSRWFTIASIIALVHLGDALLRVPGLLTLVAVPVALAVPMISLPAAIAVAVGETILLSLLPGPIIARPQSGTAIVTLVTTWAVLAVVAAMYGKVLRSGVWLDEVFHRAQEALAEAQGRRGELEQTLHDLANANRQMALASERMAALRIVAEEARKTKAAFVAKVSHELRTPLNMISGLVGLMVEHSSKYAEELPPDVQEDLKIVHRNCQHLSNLIDDVLDLTRVEEGRFTLYRERVDLAALIDSALVAVHPLVEKKGLDLEVVVPGDLPKVYCDRIRILQVLLNLMSNAARFTDAGGVSVTAVAQDGHVRVSVTDTGSGIPPEDAERIFEPFYQGSQRLWGDTGGSGLGLSISREFIRRHGGRIWLDSEVDAGTTFLFEIPISPPVDHIARPDRWIREDWVWGERAFRTDETVSPEQLIKPLVVVCDESGGLAPALSPYADKAEFVYVGDFSEIADQLHRCPARAVVLNSAQPSGLWRLMEQARQVTEGSVLVGCAVPPPLDAALQAGAAGYLVKPVTHADLDQALQAIGKPVGRVLIVDDDPDVLRLFARMLQVDGDRLEVVTATSGEQALEELDRRPPDVVLLDLVMPEIDGWQVLGRIRQDKAAREIPVILVSGQDPMNRPPTSEVAMVAAAEGLSVSQLVACFLEIPKLLTNAARALDPEPV